MSVDKAVIKVGGHLLFPSGLPDPDYVASLNSALKKCAAITRHIIVVVGGGTVARAYIRTARSIGLNEGACDAVAILVSRANAALIAAAYWGGVPPRVPETLEEAVRQARSLGVSFMGGLQPGQSTTTVASLAAEALPADLLVIATNVKGVYTADPKKDPNARLLEEVDTATLKRMFSRITGAGEYRLLDPYSLDVIERSRIKAVVLDGRDPENIVRALKGERVGTLIKPP